VVTWSQGWDSLAKLHDAHATSFTRSNFHIAAVDGVMEFVEAFGIVAILAPLARSRQEAIFSFERTNDDPHSVSDPWHFCCCFRIQLLLPVGNCPRCPKTVVQVCDGRIECFG